MGRKSRTDEPSTRRVTLVLTPKELAKWKALAKDRGVSVSELIRSAMSLAFGM